MGNRFKCSLAHGGSGGAEGNTLIVTCDPAFAGLTISASKSGTTYTQTCPSTSPYTVTFHGLEAGTWTISTTLSGDTYSTSVTITDSTAFLSYGFNMPRWVTLGGLDPTDYSDLSDVFADEAAVRRLMLVHASADYLINEVTDDVNVIDDFCADDTAMKWIGLCDYVCDGLTAIAGVETKFLASTYWERYLKDHAPHMTSNNAPYGKIESSSNLVSGGITYYPWLAFNGSNNDGNDCWHSQTGANSWIEVEFPTPVCVKKVRLQNRNATVPGPRPISTFKIQGSNDGTTWEDIGDTLTNSDTSANAISDYNISNSSYYLKMRLFVVSVVDTYAAIGELQFYGRSLNVSVPIMTSNTAPFGECNGNFDDTAYRAFDGATTTQGTATITTQPKYLGYEFPDKVCVKAVEISEINNRANYRPWHMQLKGSDDGFTTESLITSLVGSNNVVSELLTFNNSVVYKGFRLYVQDAYNGTSTSEASINYCNLDCLQFYGLDYSEKEFEAGSTKKWLYDHGVELETITAYEKTASDHVTKNSDDIYLESAANGAAEIHTDSFDLTPYDLLRIRIGDVIASSNSGATTYGSYGVADSTPAVTGASYIGKVDVTANSLPNNSGLDISSFDVTKPIAYYQASGSYTYKCKITELWLLS